MIFMCWLTTIINEQYISSVYIFTCKVKSVFFDIKTFCSEIPILYTGQIRQTEKYDADKQLIYLFTSAEKCFEHQVLGLARQAEPTNPEPKHPGNKPGHLPHSALNVKAAIRVLDTILSNY